MAFATDEQYLEFQSDVEGLQKLLENLQLAIRISTASTGARLAPRPSGTSKQLEKLFTNFKKTLEECLQLLETQACHGDQQGPLSNVQWYLLVKDEVTMQRDRIAILSSKLSLVLQTLEM